MKIILFQKHIHATNSSYASGDAWLSVETTEDKLDFKISEGRRILSEKFPMINNEMVESLEGDELFLCVSLQSDKTFYHKSAGFGRDNFSKTPEFQELVQSYMKKGFKPKDSTTSLNEYLERYKTRERDRKQAEGIVLWMDYDEYKTKPELYQGGFSTMVFKSKELKRYVESGGAFGWIGDSSVRKKWHDELIEAGLHERGVPPSIMYNWISSGDGRHFADSLEGLSDEEQKEKIEGHLNYMFNLCFIYGCPAHEGTYSSTVKISEKYSKDGILLPTDKPFNKKAHTKKLLALYEKLSQQDSLDKDEKYVFEFAKEVFLNQV